MWTCRIEVLVDKQILGLDRARVFIEAQKCIIRDGHIRNHYLLYDEGTIYCASQCERQPGENYTKTGESDTAHT